ncbi:MAG: diacylglycerol kinase family protein [Ktedonobacterales bacterium]
MPAAGVGGSPAPPDSSTSRDVPPALPAPAAPLTPATPGALHAWESQTSGALPTSASAWHAFLRGFVFAGNGLWYALRTQRNMRVHATLAALAIVLGIVLRISAIEWAIVFIAIGGVLITELLNTVVEAVVDLATPRYHPLAKTAKDVAAGAVLLNAILAVVIALFVYVPHLWPLALRLFVH